MEVFQEMGIEEHEQIVFNYDPVTGLKAIIAIYDTTLGPAMGGLRMWPYKTEGEALFDALRLSKGMAYKNSAMGLNLGGGEAVVIADPQRDKSRELFQSIGQFIDSLGGRFISVADVGITVEDMVLVRSATPHVSGLPESSGDPSPATAFGVFRSLEAAAEFTWGSPDLKGKKIAVQGVGKVGYNLVQRLLQVGAEVYVSDILAKPLEEAVKLGARAVGIEDIYALDCDIFAPCALGGILNDDTIPQLRAKIVCGSANNQLLEARHGKALSQRGILYAPDFIANGGGVINIGQEFVPGGYNKERALAEAGRVYDILLKVFALAKERNIETFEAADLLAQERIKKAAK